MKDLTHSLIMTCVRPVFQGGYDAQVHQHLDPDPSLPLRRRVLPAPPEARRHQAGHRSDAPDHPFRRRRTRQFALRHLQAAPRRPDEEVVAAALYETLPDYHVLKQRVNAALARHLPKALRRRPQILALDHTLLPFHGADAHDNDQVDRSQAKRGTCSFDAYVSAYVVRKGQRHKVALWR